MATATLADVQNRLDRPLTADEENLVPTLLDDAEALIINRIPDILGRVETDSNLRQNLVRVESYAVLRVIRNPEGYTSESEGGYTYSQNRDVASGLLTILPNEWDLLDRSRAAFSVALNVGGRDPRPWYEQPPWQFQYGDPV